jgi:transketolase
LNDLPRALDWTDIDRRVIDLIRVLAMDAVEEAGSGHPGTAMSLAPAAYLLYQHILRHDPADPVWPGRDRFVLSAGHSSLTLYLQLYLSGYGVTLGDIRSYRKWGSRTPGHPEHWIVPGVETTTGPLGQGIGNAVGMAMAARRERGLFDPGAPPGQSPFDHHIYVIASDGDIEEGVSHEVSALAGHQELGNLIVLYDDNHISIEDDTDIAKSEDVCARYAAYGWHVQRVEWLRGSSGGSPTYDEDTAALYRALLDARANTGQPSFIALRTIIGWPAPNKQNTGKIHGSALGAEEVAATKRILGFDPDVSFPEEHEAVDHARRVMRRGEQIHAEWDVAFAKWAQADSDRKDLWDRMASRRLPEGWADTLPEFPADQKGIATRRASGKVLNALAAPLPELWGGSADLAESNDTTMEGEPSFIPEHFQTKEFSGNWYGRVLHFGVREHAMGAILNGIALHGGTRPYGGTFLIFSDYMRPSVRLAAMMGLPVTYVWTHDSIGLGEDGPTHQPVEHLWALRGIPGLDVVRPGDANETSIAWRTILTRGRTAGLCLTRQNLPVFDRTPGNPDALASAEGVARGGYVLAEAAVPREGSRGVAPPGQQGEAGGGFRGVAPPGQHAGHDPDVLLIATGSEVQIVLKAREILAAEGIGARVVSMPCVEWFAEQDDSYQRSVLPPTVRARVCVEAGISLGWRAFAGEAGECVSLEHFGASAAYQTLFEKFGFTAQRVAEAARSSIARAAGATAGADGPGLFRPAVPAPEATSPQGQTRRT